MILLITPLDLLNSRFYLPLAFFLHDRKIVVFSPLHVTSFMFTKQLRNRFGDYPKVATSSMEIFLIVLLNQKWLDVVYDTFSARVPEHWNAALREAPFRSAAPRGRSAVGAQLRKWTRSASRSATPKICSAPKKSEDFFQKYFIFGTYNEPKLAKSS